jgi:O-antigen/teichoic acid export membrane protein
MVLGWRSANDGRTMSAISSDPASSVEPPLAAPSSGTATRLRSGLAYTLATVIPRAVGFLLLPVFTQVLSPSDYGQLSVALSVNSFASVVFALGFEVGVFRNYFQLAHDDVARTRYVRTTWTFLIFSSLAMALASAAILAPLVGSSHILSASRLALSLIAAAAVVAATTVPLAVLRAANRIRDYLLLNGAIAGVSTSLTLILVVWLRVGVTGWLLALVVAGLGGLIFAMYIVPYARPQPFDRRMVRTTLSLSLNVVPHLASLWALQLADRILVATLLSTGAAGVYSLGSNLALPMYMIVLGFGAAFMPDYARAGQKGSAHESLRHTIILQVAVVVILCVACALLGPPAVHLLTNERYVAAAQLVPWLVLGYGFLGLYAIPMNGITLTHGSTRGLVLVSGAGAATNIGLIVALASPYGLEAVAIASAVGYAVLLLSVLLFAKLRGATLHYPWRRLSVILGLGLVCYLGGALSSSGASAEGVAIRSAWIVVATVTVAGGAIGPRMLLGIIERRLRIFRRRDES